MSSLAFPCRSSPLTPASISPPGPSPCIKIRRSQRAAPHRRLIAARSSSSPRAVAMAAAAAAPVISPKENLPPSLTSTSEPPPLFDGTTRLYVAYHCPYAQRAWIARNYKGLQDKIKIVAIDLADRPAWYKEKVYPQNKVPSLEHNNEVKGESLDLVKYIDSNFDGPVLLPDDSAKKQFAEELLAYTDEFNKALYSSITSKGDVAEETVAALDKIEAALGKFSDGPFFLGQFSLVDIAYVPFIERFQIFFSGIKNYDITKDRPNIQKFIEESTRIHVDCLSVTLNVEESFDQSLTREGRRRVGGEEQLCCVHNSLIPQGLAGTLLTTFPSGPGASVGMGSFPPVAAH